MPNKKINQNSNVYRKNVVDNIVTVTGATQSGKSMVGPIICSLKGAENYRTDFVLEQIPMLHGLGLIDEEVAIFILRYGIELMQYDNMIGRNTNFRFSDFSSIWYANDPSEFYKRLSYDDGPSVYERIEKENSLFVLNFHNGIMHADLLFKAFPNQRMLHMVRNPIDLADAWINKNYGKIETYENPRARVLTFKYKNNLLPYYAKEWEDEYLALSEVDRVIRLLYQVHKKHMNAYKKLKDKKRVHVFTFDDFAVNTHKCLDDICAFIKTPQTLFTPIAMDREKVPREINENDIQIKFNDIKKRASNEYLNYLNQMLNQYYNKELI